MAATVSPEQMQLAWRHARRLHWPATLEAALQVPHYAICLTGIARNLSRAPWPHGAPQAPAMAAVPPTPAAPPPAAPSNTRRVAGHRGSFDARRAAANDFDED